MLIGRRSSYVVLAIQFTNDRQKTESGQILRHQYGISVAESQTFLRAKRPVGEERGETDVFAG